MKSRFPPSIPEEINHLIYKSVTTDLKKSIKLFHILQIILLLVNLSWLYTFNLYQILHYAPTLQNFTCSS